MIRRKPKKNIYIYALKENGKPESSIRWIGQTICPKGRLSAHKNNGKSAKNKHKINWMNSINKNIEMIIIEKTDIDSADIRESYWIEHYLALGYNLLNIKHGGKTSRGYKQTPESILKRKEARKGKKLSKEIRQKMSEMKKNDPKAIANMRKVGKSNKGKKGNRLGFVLSEETKRKISLNSPHRPGVKKLTNEQELYIINNIKKETVKELAKKFSIRDGLIYEILRRYKIKIEKRPLFKIKPIQVEEIRKLRVNKKIKDIAKIFNVTTSTISDILHNRRAYLLNV